jgi:hypothetical protein
MAMSKINYMRVLGRINFRSAMLGFAVTAAFVSYQLLTDSQSSISRNPALMMMFIVFCPPSVLSVPFDAEFGTKGFYYLWTCIGLLNAALYTGVRAFIMYRLKRLD